MAQWILYQMMQVVTNAPIHLLFLEGGLLIGLLWLLFHNSYNPKDATKLHLTEKEKQRLIEEWTPEPLVSDVPDNHPALKPRIVNGKAGKYIDLGGKKCLNFATLNFLDLVGNEEIEANSIKTIQKYGVGSCGPRGFYGTVDVHLELEERLASFMDMEEAAVYSYGFSTIASAIPAYAKRDDIIFVDENVNFAIQKGLDASRSRIEYFKHNDMEDLERLLIQQAELDKKNPKKAMTIRRFLVVEGIYMNTGEICPLPQLVRLRKKYKMRIFVDEHISFGTLGAHGRGVTEYFNVPKEEVDLIICSMEWAMASIGGFCVGSSFIVEHQRLSGLGYCFSASLPPLLATAAITALDLMQRDTTRFAALQAACRTVHAALHRVKGLAVGGHEHSPIKHLYLDQQPESPQDEMAILNNVVNFCADNGVAVVIAAYLERAEKFKRRDSIRITVNNAMTEEDIATMASVLQNACNQSL